MPYAIRSAVCLQVESYLRAARLARHLRSVESGAQGIPATTAAAPEDYKSEALHILATARHRPTFPVEAWSPEPEDSAKQSAGYGAIPKAVDRPEP
jgi:hypothetical protein